MSARKPLDYAIMWLRLFFGAHLMYSSLRYFVLFEPQPVVPGVGGAFVQALEGMGLFPLIKAMEGVVGACLIADLFVPLLLLAELPISVNIFYLNTIVVGTPRQLISGPQELLMNLLLIAAYFSYYRPLLRVRA
jgi:riboflavin transporter